MPCRLTNLGMLPLPLQNQFMERMLSSKSREARPQHKAHLSEVIAKLPRPVDKEKPNHQQEGNPGTNRWSAHCFSL
jgi:hypothetical protein